MVLAGGRGSRWGGQDKGLICVDQAPLALMALQRLQAQSHEALAGMAINANRHTDTYAQWGWPVWPDEDPEAFKGPLAGWQAGLRQCPTPWLLSVPCDTPDFPIDLIDTLVQAQRQSQAPLAVAASRHADELRTQAVFALMHTDLLPSLNAYLNQGGRRVADWCEAQGPSWAIFDDQDPSWDAFANLNSADEAAQRQNGRQARSTKP